MNLTINSDNPNSVAKNGSGYGGAGGYTDMIPMDEKTAQHQHDYIHHPNHPNPPAAASGKETEVLDTLIEIEEELEWKPATIPIPHIPVGERPKQNARRDDPKERYDICIYTYIPTYLHTYIKI